MNGIKEVIHQSAQHMRKLAHDNVALVEQVKKLAHELRVYKLAERMESLNLEPGLTLREKVAHIQQIPEDKLDSFEQALEFVPGGFKLGHLEDPRDAGMGVKSSRESWYQDIENFLISNQP